MDARFLEAGDKKTGDLRIFWVHASLISHTFLIPSVSIFNKSYQLFRLYLTASF